MVIGVSIPCNAEERKGGQEGGGGRAWVWWRERSGYFSGGRGVGLQAGVSKIRDQSDSIEPGVLLQSNLYFKLHL